VSRCIAVAEGRRVEVTGLVSSGVIAAGGGLCSFLLLRKERRRMKGLEIVSGLWRSWSGNVSEEHIPNGR